MKLIHILLRPTILAITLLAFLITIELCARFDDNIKYNAPFWGNYNEDILRSRDSNGVPYNVPNAGFEKWQNNRLGFRGTDFSINKLPRTIRIVCVGSSESYGLYESPGNEWPAQFQRTLGSPRYQVVNASVVGMPLINFSSYLRKHVFPLKPDIIVLTINPHLYALVMENSSKPARRSSPRKIAKNNLQFASIPSHLRILPKFKQVLKRTLSDYLPNILEHYQLNNLQQQIIDLERTNLKGNKPKDNVPDSYSISFRSDLNKLIDLCQSNKINVLLTTYPTLMTYGNLNKYPILYLDYRRFYIVFSYKGLIDIDNKINAVVRSLAKERHLMFVDVEALLPKSTLYFADNVHYTDQGSHIIAYSIANSVLTGQ